MPLTVVFTPFSATPAGLLMFSELKVVGFEPPIVWTPLPLNLNVPKLAVNVPLLLKLPLTLWLNDDAPATNVVPGPSVKFPLIVIGVAGIVFVPLVLRLRFPYVSLVTV